MISAGASRICNKQLAPKCRSASQTLLWRRSLSTTNRKAKTRVCVAGVSGWTGALVAKAAAKSDSAFELVAGIARSKAGEDLGLALGLPARDTRISPDLAHALTTPFDVLIDYTKPDSVKQRVLAAVGAGKHVVVGTSGLVAADFEEIDAAARSANVGVFAAGNFSITAALASHCAQLAARVLPWAEIIDYAHEVRFHVCHQCISIQDKIDAPSGTTQELAEKIGAIRPSKLGVELQRIHGRPEARGADIAGTRVHSVRLPGYVISFEALFGLPHERLSIRHDAGSGAEPYVAGSLLAAQKVREVRGLVRGLDTLLFADKKR